MKRVSRYVTSDGVEHPDVSAAARYADERYGAALTKLAREAVQIDKYSTMLVFLENNLDAFAACVALREDRAIEPERDE